ncbi:MAG: hypothetical protein WC809_09925 [Sinimarinibacterium sp.]|jgi:hypothetical protein
MALENGEPPFWPQDTWADYLATVAMDPRRAAAQLHGAVAQIHNLATRLHNYDPKSIWSELAYLARTLPKLARAATRDDDAQRLATALQALDVALRDRYPLLHEAPVQSALIKIVLVADMYTYIRRRPANGSGLVSPDLSMMHCVRLLTKEHSDESGDWRARWNVNLRSEIRDRQRPTLWHWPVDNLEMRAVGSLLSSRNHLLAQPQLRDEKAHARVARLCRAAYLIARQASADARDRVDLTRDAVLHAQRLEFRALFEAAMAAQEAGQHPNCARLLAILLNAIPSELRTMSYWKQIGAGSAICVLAKEQGYWIGSRGTREQTNDTLPGGLMRGYSAEYSPMDLALEAPVLIPSWNILKDAFHLLDGTSPYYQIYRLGQSIRLADNSFPRPVADALIRALLTAGLTRSAHRVLQHSTVSPASLMHVTKALREALHYAPLGAASRRIRRRQGELRKAWSQFPSDAFSAIETLDIHEAIITRSGTLTTGLSGSSLAALVLYHTGSVPPVMQDLYARGTDIEAGAFRGATVATLQKVLAGEAEGSVAVSVCLKSPTLASLWVFASDSAEPTHVDVPMQQDIVRMSECVRQFSRHWCTEQRPELDIPWSLSHLCLAAAIVDAVKQATPMWRRVPRIRLAVDPIIPSLPWQALLMSGLPGSVVTLLPSLGWFVTPPSRPRRQMEFVSRLGSGGDDTLRGARNDIERLTLRVRTLKDKFKGLTVLLGHHVDPGDEDGFPGLHDGDRQMSVRDWIDVCSRSRVLLVNACEAAAHCGNPMHNLHNLRSIATFLGVLTVCAPVCEVPREVAVKLSARLLDTRRSATIVERYREAIRTDPRCAVYELSGFSSQVFGRKRYSNR